MNILYSLYFQTSSDVTSQSVLCIGCGLGEECDYIKSSGAERVVGIDTSEGMLEQAKLSYPNVKFFQMDMQMLELPSNTFDIIFSSLTIHYCNDWTIPLREIYRVLKDDGIAIFSTHHPAAWGGHKEETESSKTQLLGYSLDKKTKELQIYGDYFTSRKIEGKFFGKFNVVY